MKLGLSSDEDLDTGWQLMRDGLDDTSWREVGQEVPGGSSPPFGRASSCYLAQHPLVRDAPLFKVLVVSVQGQSHLAGMNYTCLDKS
ncbi:MAG TPA: hypothetical protein VFC19_06165 [Candidatus Limnocylindrales bacterium]|nr:hypothetical protein [Candidatus Limnocylindrales bacterium]